jgi:phosphate transport system substrate-binding protein
VRRTKIYRRASIALGLAGILWTGQATAETSSAARPVVDSQIAEYVARPNVSGMITIAGSDTMQPIVAKVVSVFRKWQPQIKIAVQGGGSDAALSGFVSGIAASRRGDGNVKGHLSSNEVTVLASSRPLTATERKTFHIRHGFDPIEVPIALDAVAIYVNHQNPVTGLTMEQVDAIFSQSRKRGFPTEITLWGQVGLADGWEHQSIRLYGRDTRSGTRSFFMQTALLDGDLKPTVREAPGTAMEILELSRDVSGIGYAGIGFQASTVRILPIAKQAGAPMVLPSAEAASSGDYPLARPLYLYAKPAAKGNLPEDIQELLSFIHSREGQETIVKTGVFPLPASQITTNIQALDRRSDSSRFMAAACRK